MERVSSTGIVPNAEISVYIPVGDCQIKVFLSVISPNTHNAPQTPGEWAKLTVCYSKEESLSRD